ncbi:serpin family protein [Egibacter rhizosphaerae]|uniref:serpin family protein n=1 Tax=Egibacter rhizosphaerae TaxID=1670831 RepID=UPI0023EA6017|nr:serpin family protein [Egibacter rhizosphaerae]
MARLPYGEHEEATDARFGFEVLLPTDEASIAAVLDELSADEWRELSERASRKELPVVLPTFDLEAEHDLTAPLKALGIERAWGDGHDFTGMSPNNPWLETVAQKAVIEVDEEGTEAAAVTGGVMAESAPALTEVVVDRSFAFAVRDTENGVPLFLGFVDDPG